MHGVNDLEIPMHSRHFRSDSVQKSTPLSQPAASLGRELPSLGRELPSSLRRAFEPAFQHDFSRVRVHREGERGATQVSGASPAASRGIDITLAASAPIEDPVRFRRLMAHELAHVVQSERSGTPSSIAAIEQEAHAAGERAAVGGSPQVVLTAEPGQVLHAPPELGNSLTSDRGSQLPETSEGHTLDDFDTNKATLKPAHLDLIGRVAGELMRRPLRGGYITVIGHADAVGPSPDNKALGQQRADAVRNALIGAGVPPNDVRAYSLSKSVLAIDTQKASARNRRVEIVVRRRHLNFEASSTHPANAGGFTNQHVAAPRSIGSVATDIAFGKGISDNDHAKVREEILNLAIENGASKKTTYDQAVEYLARHINQDIAKRVAKIGQRFGIDPKWIDNMPSWIDSGLQKLLKMTLETLKKPAETGPVDRLPTATTVGVPMPFPTDKPAPANKYNATIFVTNRPAPDMTKTWFKPGETISFAFTTPPSFTQARAAAEIVPASGGSALRRLDITGRRSGTESLIVPDAAGSYILQVRLVGDDRASATFRFSVQ